MTAINAIATPDAAYMVTDTAIYTGMGMVAGFSTKVITLPHLRMALATSGAREQLSRVVDNLMIFASFDDVVDNAPAHLREMVEADLFDHAQEDLDGYFRLVIIGWSDRSRCAQLCALSTEEEPQFPPFTFSHLPICLTPNVHMDALRDAGLVVCDAAEVGDPEAWLTRLIEIQRQRAPSPRGSAPRRENVFDDESVFVVGGHAILTRIDRHGISQRIIRDWQDQMHDWIKP